VPLEEFALDQSPSLGSPGAAVTMVEFADFLCFHCARSARTYHQLLERYPGQVRWVFKHFPLRTRRPDHDIAHLASVAAEAQGKFWPMHALLFQHQKTLGREEVKRLAQELNLDAEPFARIVDGRRMRAAILRDTDLGRRLQVTATPTTFINGRRVVGAQPIRELRKVIDEELSVTTAAKKPGSGFPD
jgi:protein-disulfide isomerase